MKTQHYENLYTDLFTEIGDFGYNASIRELQALARYHSSDSYLAKHYRSMLNSALFDSMSSTQKKYEKYYDNMVHELDQLEREMKHFKVYDC